MDTEISGVLLIYVLAILLAIPFGKYIARVFAGEKTWLDPVFNPLERGFFKLCGIDPAQEMTWKQHLRALLIINLIWFFFGMFILMNQGWLPWNPDGNPSLSPHLAFNTVISFIVNCNLQHYSGETGLSYLGQIFAIQFFQFVSAGAGIAACAILFNAMRERTATHLGNFYDYFLKSCTRILLPVALVGAIILAFRGTPQTFEGKDTMITLQGDTVQVSRGPVAGMVSIKQAGTNGGGWFGVNSAHPLENPDYLTNAVENIFILLIPMALVFAL
ncbi:MAG: potassium-transporting ATPase subunit KdpA, partial [Bacteroidota bacterium]